jgi:zinc protease
VERAIASIDEEVGMMGRDGVSDKELADAKQYLIGSIPRMLETNARIAAFLQTVEQFDLGLDYDARLAGLLEAVSLEEVRDAAASLLAPDRAAVAVAGPIDSASGEEART